MVSPFITDDELRAAGVSELDIDALDRLTTTQKLGGGSRSFWAVKSVLHARGVNVDLLSKSRAE